jgi:invasion protein IalB
MKNLLIPFVVGMFAVLPGAQAQETKTETPTATTETATTEKPAIDQEFPVAEETTEPKEGDGYLKATHGKWEVRCVKAAETVEEDCRLFNLLPDSEGNNVAQFDMQALPKGGKAVAGVDVATPLGSLLPAQVMLKIDAGKAVKYPYTWCDQLGCYARFGMTSAEISSMKKGAKATITIVSVAAPDEPLNLDLSLVGFTAAWTAIEPK